MEKLKDVDRESHGPNCAAGGAGGPVRIVLWEPRMSAASAELTNTPSFLLHLLGFTFSLCLLLSELSQMLRRSTEDKPRHTRIRTGAENNISEPLREAPGLLKVWNSPTWSVLLTWVR